MRAPIMSAPRGKADIPDPRCLDASSASRPLIFIDEALKAAQAIGAVGQDKSAAPEACAIILGYSSPRIRQVSSISD